MARVRISDVAREAGVSVGTASNALNHPNKVKQETLDQVNAAIARLGYVPNQAARQLAGSESRVFGLVLPRLDHAFSLQIANGAQAESRKRGYDLLIASAGNDDILTNHYMRYFLGAHVAGVLVQPMADTSWDPETQEAPVPTVYLDVHSRAAVNCVAADNEAQGRLIMEHATDRGARRVAIIGKPDFMQLTLRTYGIREAARNADAEVEFVGLGSWNSVKDGFELGRELARRSPEARPDFVIGLTDVLAAGAIAGFAAAGLSVPNDLLVAGCDGNPLAWGGTVPLTTIKSPGYEIGQKGVQLLLDELSQPEAHEPRQELVAPSLIERMSTASTPAERKRAEEPELDLAEYL